MPLFKRRDGRAPDRATLLDTYHFPSYLELGKSYRVIERKEIGMSLTGGPLYQYLVQGPARTDEAHFVRCYFKLPPKFWVRKIVIQTAYFEFLPEGETGEPRQVTEAKRAEGMPSAVPA